MVESRYGYKGTGIDYEDINVGTDVATKIKYIYIYTYIHLFVYISYVCA